ARRASIDRWICPQSARATSCCLGTPPLSTFRHSAAGLAALAREGSLGTRVAEHVRSTAGGGAGPSEVRSWDRSLPILANDLIDAGLGGVEVIVEHRLPLTSKRIDAVLAGVDPRTGDDSYVVVELKQWGS